MHTIDELLSHDFDGENEQFKPALERLIKAHNHIFNVIEKEFAPLIKDGTAWQKKDMMERWELYHTIFQFGEICRAMGIFETQDRRVNNDDMDARAFKATLQLALDL